MLQVLRDLEMLLILQSTSALYNTPLHTCGIMCFFKPLLSKTLF